MFSFRVSLACLVLCLAVVGCSSDSGSSDEGSQQNGPVDARYRVTFSDNWTAANFPTEYPTNAHFSGLIGVTHNEQSIFWEAGQPASPGIKDMAETGAKSDLIDEIEAKIAEGTAENLISGSGIGSTPGMVSVEFAVSRSFPEITLVSMVAPSPDWFVGIRNQSLLDESGEFIASLNIDLAVYDAGTDQGSSFVATNNPSTGELITLLSCAPEDCDFENGQHRDSEVAEAFIGQFLIEKIEE